MKQDFTYKIIEDILTLKKYKNREEVITACTLAVKNAEANEHMSSDMKTSYKSALEKLNSLSFEEMKEIIDILTDDEDDGDCDEIEEDYVISDMPDTGIRDYNKGMKLFNSGNYTDAYVSFQISAGKGNPKAHYNCGVCLYNGIGVSKNAVFAVKQFVIASDAGIKEADLMLKCIINNKNV